MLWHLRPKHAANKHGVNNRGASAVDMNGPPHFRRTRKSRVADEAGVEDRHTNSAVCVEGVVMVRKHQRATGLEGLRHICVDGRKPFREMFEVPALRYVSCQLIQGACRYPVETFGFLADQTL